MAVYDEVSAPSLFGRYCVRVRDSLVGPPRWASALTVVFVFEVSHSANNLLQPGLVKNLHPILRSNTIDYAASGPHLLSAYGPVWLPW